MMRVSARGRYGLRAVLDLALHYGRGQVQNADITARQEIPGPYLAQILTLLRNRGIVSSTRGPHGGHALIRHPDEITVGEVLSVLEGPVDLSGESEEPAAGEAEPDVLREVWKAVEEAIEGVLSSITFGDLCRRHQMEQANIVYRI